MQRTAASRTVSGGSFADLNEDLLRDETLVAYAAAGTTAADGRGRNSPVPGHAVVPFGDHPGDADAVPKGAGAGAGGNQRSTDGTSISCSRCCVSTTAVSVAALAGMRPPQCRLFSSRSRFSPGPGYRPVPRHAQRVVVKIIDRDSLLGNRRCERDSSSPVVSRSGPWRAVDPEAGDLVVVYPWWRQSMTPTEPAGHAARRTYSVRPNASSIALPSVISPPQSFRAHDGLPQKHRHLQPLVSLGRAGRLAVMDLPVPLQGDFVSKAARAGRGHSLRRPDQRTSFMFARPAATLGVPVAPRAPDPPIALNPNVSVSRSPT